MVLRPTLLLTRRFPPDVEARAARDYDLRPRPDDRPLVPSALIAGALGAEALLVTPSDRLDAATIAGLPASVRLVACYSVGTDHVDLAAARARGLVVTNTPDVLTEATADLTLLLVLAATRRAGEGERAVRAAPGTDGAWSGWAPTHLLGRSLAGKRLAILGMGRIGQAVAARARAFGLVIHYSNRRRLPPDQEHGARYHADADAMLDHADILSFHCPATAETRGWLSAERIERLPPRAVVINTARGTLVQDAALIAALRAGRLFAAGLDVYDQEPALHPAYRTLENVFLLPHLGSATEETRTAMGFRALDNADAFFAGREPPDRVA